MPLLADILQRHCTGDFAVDVHNFPEMSRDAVPRAIYITLPAEIDDTKLEETIRSALTQALPEEFRPVHLEFRRGEFGKSTWWGQVAGEMDQVCEPKNVTFNPTPVIGMSIGPAAVPDAASLGGFVRVGAHLYAMSAFHAFEESINAGNTWVTHPAGPDLSQIVPNGRPVRPYSIGTVTMWSPRGTLRPSLTFEGTGFARNSTMVEMDWCLIGPVPDGKNFVSLPSSQMDQFVSVSNTALVEGNTEVYALARTSGYSFGFTSDVPGLLRISGRY
ncbi:hypothetical protein VTI74DRAFT_5906 [Chaetomium olivicolor]